MDKYEKLKALKAEFERRIEEVMREADPPIAIDWNDPAWVGRLVEVEHEGEWRVSVCTGNRRGKCVTGTGDCEWVWDKARLYTGPTRPNWIEWNGAREYGECPVDRNVFVNVLRRDGSLGGGAAGNQFWMRNDSASDIMRYSVVVP